MEKQLNLVFHLSKLDDTSLGKQVYDEQDRFGFPGLVTDVKKYLKNLDLPCLNDYGDTSKQQFKRMVKKAVMSDCERELMEQIKASSKLSSGDMVNEKFGKKDYINELKPGDARQIYKYRSSMYDVQWNYKSNPKYASELWKCSSCESAIETQQHVLYCPAYNTLREGKDINSDQDLAEYLQKVLSIREKLKLTK